MVLLAQGKSREQLLLRREQITVQQEHSRDSWNALCELFADAEFAQCFEWGEAKRGQGWEPIRLSITEHGFCLGAVQALKRVYYGFPIVYCPRGPLWQRKQLPRESQLANFGIVVDALRSRFGTATLLCDWHCADNAVPDELLKNRGFTRVHQGITSWIDLRRDERDLLSSFHGKWRNDLQSAKRSGIVVEVRDPSPKLDELYGIVAMAATRKGFRIGVDGEVLRRFLALRDPARDVVLMARQQGGTTLAVALIVSFNSFASYLLGASLPSGHPAFIRGASNLMQWAAIQWAKEHQHQAYNLEGLEQERNPGVYHFKKRMNGNIFARKGLWIWTKHRFRTKLFGSVIKRWAALQ